MSFVCRILQRFSTFFCRFNRPETLYNCDSLAKPILHDTIVQLSIDREMVRNLGGKQESMSSLLFEPDEDASRNGCDGSDFVVSENIQVRSFNLEVGVYLKLFFSELHFFFLRNSTLLLEIQKKKGWESDKKKSDSQ